MNPGSPTCCDNSTYFMAWQSHGRALERTLLLPLVLVTRPGLRFDLLNPAGCILGTPLGRGGWPVSLQQLQKPGDRVKLSPLPPRFLLKAPRGCHRGRAGSLAPGKFTAPSCPSGSDTESSSTARRRRNQCWSLLAGIKGAGAPWMLAC